MRLLALSLISLGLAAPSASGQISNGTIPVPSTLAGQNVGSVNAAMGRSNGFPAEGVSTPQSPSASPGTVPSGDGMARSVVPPAPSGIPSSAAGTTPPPGP